MSWAAAAGAGVSLASDLIAGSKDGPDLQPWARVGEGMKRNYFPRVNEFADRFNGDDLYQGTMLGPNSKAVTDGQRQQIDLTSRWNGQVRRNADTIEGFLDYNPNSPINQARRNAFSDQAMTNFDRNIRPAIEDRGTFGGQFGGPQQALAVGAAGADTMRDINSFEAQMMEADRNRALQASGMAGQIFAQQAMPLQNKEMVGMRMNQRSQQELDDRIMQHNQPYDNNLRANMDMAGLYNPFSGLGYQGNAGGSNPVQALTAGAITAHELFPDWNPFASSGSAPDTDNGFGGWDGNSNGYW